MPSKYRHCRTINFCVVRGTESKNVFNKYIYLLIIIIKLFVRITRMRSQILAVLIVGLCSRSRKSLQKLGFRFRAECSRRAVRIHRVVTCNPRRIVVDRYYLSLLISLWYLLYSREV